MPLWLSHLRDRLIGALPGKRLMTGGKEALSGGVTPRPDGPLIWVDVPNEAGFGAVQTLLKALLEARDDISVLLTSDTTYGGDDSAQILHRPRPTAAAAFLDHWQPTLALGFASGLSAALSASHRRALPLYLICDAVPGRLPRALIKRFERVFATTPEQAEALRKQGVPEARLEVAGALNRSLTPPKCNETERENLARLLTGRPAWLAANVSPLEEHIALEAQATAARLSHRLLLILVPDDPRRGAALAQELRREGWRVALRSDDEEPQEETQIFVADTEGEMALWLYLAPVCFVGGSLDRTAKDGCDPALPAALGSAILHGPNTAAHADFYARLGAADAARTVRDAVGLARALNALNAPDKAALLALNAWGVSTAGADAAHRVVGHLLTCLTNAEGA